MHTTTQKSSTLNLDPFLKSLHTRHTSLTLNMNLTPLGMKNYMIKTSWSTKILTTNLKIKLKVMTHVSDALRYALIGLWTVNPHLPDTSPLANFQWRPQNQQRQTAIIDDQALPQLQVTQDGLTRFLPLSTNLSLKNRPEILYFPLGFGELNFDGLIGTGALSSTVPEADLRNLRLLAPHKIINEDPLPESQNMGANRQLEAPISRIAARSR